MELVIGAVIGICAGILGGLFGIGGGILIVPACIYLLGFTQARAQGTSLVALLLPVGILGVLNYAKAGNVDWKVGAVIAVLFVGGAYFGSKIALSIDENLLRKLFAGFLVLIAIQLFLKK
jgi:uncharacterized membrane protein YfcA